MATIRYFHHPVDNRPFSYSAASCTIQAERSERSDRILVQARREMRIQRLFLIISA
ncbi:MAG: hypothetical protein HY787_10725 [Deltaproteobacteria bacterium]|nr:hypothetical protein [Deltaproteobacteria bacterium]